jgi:DNA invertase Pin-like site-specific DNA recombinase
VKQLPAQLLISRFGTASEIARVLDLDKSTVSRWANPLDPKGTRGYVPRKYWKDLLNVARQRRIALTVNDLAGL